MPTEPRKPRRMPVEVLTRAEVNRLMKACSRKAPSGLRDRALIAVMSGAGLRVSEALALKVQDVDLERGAITVQSGKGDKRRVCGIDDGSLSVVREWIACRKGLTGRRSGLVFVQITKGRIGRPVQAAAVRQMVARRAKRAGITKRTHCHGLRHHHAVALVNDLVPLPVIAAQLGHASTSTTHRYVSHLSAADVVDTVRNRVSKRRE